MAEKAKISVIIPVYNVESYIERCLESVMNQSLSDIEIICIDDKSEDNSLHIIKQYCQTDKRIKCLCNEINKGLSYARNLGIRTATGKYVFLLDSDDAMTMGALEKLYNIAESSKCQMVFFDFVNKYESVQLHNKLKYKDRDRTNLNGEWRGADLFVKMVEDSDMQPQAWVKLYSRDFLLCKKLFFQDGMLHEDIPYAVKAMFRAERIYFTGEKLYEWWHRESSITTTGITTAHIEGRIKGILEIIEFSNHIKATQKEQTAIEKYVISLIDVTKQKLRLLGNSEDIFKNNLKYRLLSDMMLYPKDKRINMRQKVRILEAGKFFIYGAGIIARMFMEEIAQCDICICGVIVTELQDKMYFYGHRIKEAKSITDDMKNSMVIVATSQTSYEEIGDNLKRLGFKHVEYLEWES